MYGKAEKEETSGPGTHRVMGAFRSGRLFAYLRRLWAQHHLWVWLLALAIFSTRWQSSGTSRHPWPSNQT
jgi:hypothetical protein